MADVNLKGASLKSSRARSIVDFRAVVMISAIEGSPKSCPRSYSRGVAPRNGWGFSQTKNPLPPDERLPAFSRSTVATLGLAEAGPSPGSRLPHASTRGAPRLAGSHSLARACGCDEKFK